MTSTRLSSRTAAGTLAGLMGAGLLLPALTAKAAPLEFDCYSRTTQELLVKAAYDMSNGGMACLKSSAATTESAETSSTTAEAPVETVATETASATTEDSKSKGEAGRAPGLGAVIVGGIVSSLMDRLLDRLLPGATGDAAAVDAAVIDGEAEAIDAAVMDPGMAAAEPEAQPQQQPQQASGGRPIPNFGSLVNKTSIIPGLLKQTPVKPMPRPQLPTWFSTKRPTFKPLPGPLVGNLGNKSASTPLPNFSSLRTLR